MFHAGLKNQANMQNHSQTYTYKSRKCSQLICPPLKLYAVRRQDLPPKKNSQSHAQIPMEVCAFGSLVSHAARRAALTAARIPLASSLVYEPVLTQFTSVTPACFSHVHDPKRFVNTLQKPENELRNIKHFPPGKPLSSLHPV
jgi:hypothetical protein